MAGMIKNIFGLDTEDVLKERAERNRLLAAQRIKQGNIDPTVAILGQQFGDMLGRGLMKKLGYEDPEMSRAELAEQFDKDIKDKIASGELDPASKDYNLLMARYYGQLGDSQNQLRQMELFRIKENDEFAKQDKIAGRYIQLVSEFNSHEEAIKQLEGFYPGSDFSKLKGLNIQSDVDSEGTKPTGLTTEQVLAKGTKEEEKSIFDSVKDFFNTDNEKETTTRRTRKAVREDPIKEIRRGLDKIGEPSTEEFLSGKRRGGKRIRNPNYNPF
jgi:hypothetical protein